MSQHQRHEDQKYIDGLAQNNSFVIQAIYNRFVPKVVNYIKANSGDMHQAQDVIQDVLMIIYDQAVQEKFQLTCPFDAYFFLLCKRKWLNVLKKSSRKEVTINEEVVSKSDEAHELVEETQLFEHKQELFSNAFEKLGQACKDLLKTTLVVKSMEEVARQLGVSYAYARKKKSLCMGKLAELVKQLPGYHRLKF